jgi:hypothetical protein
VGGFLDGFHGVKGWGCEKDGRLRSPDPRDGHGRARTRTIGSVGRGSVRGRRRFVGR